MVKFVWVEAVDGSKVPVNPDRVAYLRRTAQGNTAVVFSAFAGGLDQLEVAGDGAEVVALLEAEPLDVTSPLGRIAQALREKAAGEDARDASSPAAPPRPPPIAPRSPRRKGGKSPL